MARINTYKNDENISESDKLLGTDKDSGLKPTRNYTVKDLRDFILDGVDVTSQNNIPTSITLPQILEPSNTTNVLIDASNLINEQEQFIISSVEVPFFTLRRGNRIYVLTFQGLGKGTYGQGTEPISLSNLQVISEKTLNLENIEQASTTTTINLFGIGSSNVNEIVNILNPPINIKPISEGFTVFIAVQNGEEKAWVYNGDSGLFGLGAGQTSLFDFNEITTDLEAEILPNKPVRINSTAIVNPNQVTIEQFCTIGVNFRFPAVTFGAGDIPFYSGVYGDEFVVWTLNGVNVNRTFGASTTPLVTVEQIQVISRRPLNANLVNETTTEYIDIIASVSGTDNVWERVNLDDYNVQPLNQGFTVFRATVNGEVKQWLYKGESGDVGLNGYKTTENDFQLLSSNENIIPNLQQVVDVDGNYVYAEFPSGTYLEDDGGSFSFVLEDKTISFNLNGALFINANNLRIKGSNPSLEGRALVVQADGSVDWEEISVDLSAYITTQDLTDAFDSLGELAFLDTIDTPQINNQAVTNTKLANMNANTVKGRLNGNGTPQDIPMADLPISTATQTALNQKQGLPQFLTVPVNAQLDLSNTAGNYYNLTSPTTEIDFTLINKVAGAFAIIRINANTNNDPALVTLNETGDVKKSDNDNWIDNEDVDLGIFVRDDLTVEWEFKSKNF